MSVEQPAPEVRISRLAAILAAMLALVGAVVANLQLDASAEGAIETRKAQQFENQAFGSQVRATADLANQVDLDAVVSEYERRSVFSASRRRVAATPEEAAQLDAEAAVWREAATRVAKLSPVAEQQRAERNRVRRPTERELDALDRFDARRQAVPDRVGLQRAAAAERAGDIVAQSSAYIGILALLAVALFLVGLSLTLPPAHRPWVIGAATLLLVVGSAWTVGTATKSVSSTPRVAIDAVARGSRRVATGHPRSAERSLERAIELRPDYAEAFARRSQARAEQALAFRGGRLVGIRIVEDRARLDGAIEDAVRALRAGYADSDVPLALGEYFALEHRYGDALAANRRAIDVSPNEPSAWLDRAVYETAVGNEAEALRAVNRGIRLTRDRRYVFAGPELLSAIRTELERIAASRPERRALVRRLESRLVVATLETFDDIGRVERIAPDTVRVLKQQPFGLDFPATFFVDSGTVVRHFEAEAPRGTPFAFLWYVRDGRKSPWVEAVGATTTAKAFKFPFEHPEGAKAGVFQFPSFDPGACAGRREYRLDVWASNVRVASMTAKDFFDDTHRKLLHVGERVGDAQRIKDDVLGLELCRPKGWKADRSDDGVVRIESPDGKTSVEATSVPVGDLPEVDRHATDRATVDRLAAGLASEGAAAPLQRDSPAEDGSTDFANFDAYVGGHGDARAGVYQVQAGTVTKAVALGAFTGADGVQRTIRIDAPLGESFGADYVTEFLTTIRFDVGPSLSAATADEGSAAGSAQTLLGAP